MEFNWTLEVILTFLSLIPFLISFAISIRQYRKNRYQHNLLLCFIWISNIGWIVLHGVSKLILSKPLYWCSGFFITVVLVTVILFGESLENDIKISPNLLFALLLQSLIVIVLYTDSVVEIEIYQNNVQSLRLNHPYLQFLIFGEMIFSTIYVIYIMTKIYLNVPVSMKKRCLSALIGVIIFSSTGVLYVMVGGEKLIPGLNMFFTFLGSFIFGLSFLSEPKIFHVLSFKVLRLQVIDTKSGISLYSYTWKAGKELEHEDLFSGMVQGISLIVQEAIKRGTVEEIKLSQGVVIVEKIPNSSIVCILVANKSTAPLRDAIKNFATKFYEKFHVFFNNVAEVSNFSQSSEIIEFAFPFLWDE